MDETSRGGRLMSTPAAARYLDAAESTLEKARVSGAFDLPFVKLGKRVAYDIADLDAFIERRKRRSTSEHPSEDTPGGRPRRAGAR
jgi:hypothetical protein